MLFDPWAPKLQTYTAEQRFFDDLVNICISVACFKAATLVRTGHSGIFDPRERIELSGAASRVALVFEPGPLLEAVVRDERPATLTLWKQPRTVPVGQPLREPQRVLIPVLQAAFVHYYASVEGHIAKAYGKRPAMFREPLCFGWVVRNACAHDGRVLIKDAKLVARWYDLTYRQTDNDRQIIGTDLMPADLIVLMEEMDAAF